MPGGFETPGHAASLCAYVVSEEDAGNMEAGSLPNRPADINVDVICTFHRGKEGFNGIGSIETDIYYGPEWVRQGSHTYLPWVLMS